MYTDTSEPSKRGSHNQKKVKPNWFESKKVKKKNETGTVVIVVKCFLN